MRTSQKVRALLAAGVVLGVGATATLASWTDDEFVSASLTSGTFGIQSTTKTENPTDEDYAEHATAESAAQLSFAVPATDLMPGNRVYASLSVRTIKGSAPGTASVAADAGNAGGLGKHLRYGLKIVSGAPCNSASYGSSQNILVPSGSELTIAGTASIPLAADAKSAQTLCFEIELPLTAPNEAQGLAATPRWTVNAQAS